MLLGHTRRIEGPDLPARPIRLELTGLPPAFANGALVTVRHMPYQGEVVLPEPPIVLTTTVPVRDGQATVFLGSLPLHDAWEVHAVPAKAKKSGGRRTCAVQAPFGL
ncbi:MAG: hypothetical protein Q9O62_08460 [Ardenticatenia bacterium]|nr:hypothetical protein [Ardenticatenia bacterium]